MVNIISQWVVHSNRILILSITAAVTAQIIKFGLYVWNQKRPRMERLIGAGGMPSAHSAMVSSLVSATGYQYGWRSPLFAIATVFSLIVLYDATGLRRTVGLQSRYLNQVSRKGGLDRVESQEFPEFVGHTPLEVLVGAVWGIFLTTLFY